MNKVVEAQIISIFKNYNFPTDKFKFIKIKDNIYKMTLDGKFITYIEVTEGVDTKSQTKLWTSSRKDLIEYIKKILLGNFYEVFIIMDIKDTSIDVTNRAIRSILQQKQDIYITLVTSSFDDIKIAIANNVEFYWTQERSQYHRYSVCINSMRSIIGDIRYIMLCSSYDIFHNNWINECLNTMNKKCDVVGKEYIYILEDTHPYKISVDQDFGKNVIPHQMSMWTNICMHNGLMFRKSLLKKIKWNLISRIFDTNITFGLYERLLFSGAKFGYVKNSDIISVCTKTSSIIKELSNKSFIIDSLLSLPIIDNSGLLDSFNVKLKQLTIISPIINPVKTNQPIVEDKIIVPERKKIERKENIDRPNLIIPVKKPLVSKQYNALKSANKIITMIICTNSDLIKECLKYLSSQTVKTDILFILSTANSKDFAETIKENYIYVDTDNDITKILQGLNYVKNMNPSFVMILYDFVMLSHNWIKDSLSYIKRHDLDILGVDSFYIYNTDNKDLLLSQLNKDTLTFLPLHARDMWPVIYGLIIYNRILHKVDWNLFLTNTSININISLGLKTIEQLVKFRCYDKIKLLVLGTNKIINEQITNKYVINNKVYREDLDYSEFKKIHQMFINTLGDKFDIKPRKSTIFKTTINNNIDTIPNTFKQSDIDSNYNTFKLDIIKSDKYINLSIDNKIVQGLWIGDSLSTVEKVCILSFIKHGHEFHLYTYNKVKNVPDNCIIKDANEILPENEIFYYDTTQSLSGKRTPAAFSNIFRYKLLYDKGGYWIDMDMICFKPFNFKEEYVFSSELSPDGEVINCGVMKCPKGSDFANYCYNICNNKDKSKIKWGEIGPSLTKESVYKYDLEKYVKSWDTFCPIDYKSINKFVNGNCFQIDKKWYSVHLWNELWRKNNINKDNLNFQFISSVLFNINLDSILNKAGVLFVWIPITHYSNKLKSNSEKREINCNGKINYNDINNFLQNDIYYDIMFQLKQMNIINNIHIVFSVKDTEYDSYGNKFNMFEQTYLYYKNVHFWRLNNLSDMFLFKNASFILNRGFYESLYVLGKFNKQSFIVNYPATAFYQKLIANKIEYNIDSFASSFTYDTVLVDEDDKLNLYKNVFKKTKDFVKFYKLGFKDIENVDNNRLYDIIYFGSIMYPTKNTELFIDYLQHLDNNKKKLRICYVSKFIDKDSLPLFKFINVTQINNADHNKIKSLLLNSKNTVIFSGRDANPRIISEALSCGCYCICLSTLSDGYSMIKNNQDYGKIITAKKMYEKSLSISCYPDPDMFDEITSEIELHKNHSLISIKFNQYINKQYSNQINKMFDIYKKSSKGTYILTLATEDYLKPMNYLLSSIKHTNPDLVVVAICVNCNKSIISEFSKNYPDYVFYEHYINKNYQKGDILKLKVDVQQYFFEKYEKPFMWIDADTIVIKSIKQLLYNLWDYNLMVYTRFEENDYMKFALGVVGYGFGLDIKTTKFILTEYTKVVHNISGYNGWFHDQLALWDVYEKNKKDLKVYRLNENEHSLNMNKTSMIVSRRRGGEDQIQKMLNGIRCPVADINFKDIKTCYDY